MTELPEEMKRALVTRFLDSRPTGEPLTGPPTSLTCTCGGVLHERRIPPPKLPGLGPRRSRNRRIRKKQLKRWARTHGRLIMAMHIIRQTSRPMGYRCASCRRHVGFYHAIATNMIKVEPMPPGALPFYDRDIDVAGIVLETHLDEDAQ